MKEIKVSFVYQKNGKEIESGQKVLLTNYDNKGFQLNTLLTNLSFDIETFNLLWDYQKKVLYHVLGDKKKVLHLYYKIFDRLTYRLYDIPYNAVVKKIKVWGINQNRVFNVNNSCFPNTLCLIKQIVVENQYHIFNTPNFVRDKIIIDAGANLGIFSIYAATLGAKKVYAFEPVKETFDMLCRNIAENGLQDIIVPVNAGLGEKKCIGVIAYRSGGDGTATFCENIFSEDRIAENRIKDKVQIITIDDFVKGNDLPKLDFLKMDAEGYEKQILKGAKTVIKQYKPVICCSAYHFSDDKNAIPTIVNGIRADYKYKLEKSCEQDLLFY